MCYGRLSIPRGRRPIGPRSALYIIPRDDGLNVHGSRLPHLTSSHPRWMVARRGHIQMFRRSREFGESS